MIDTDVRHIDEHHLISSDTYVSGKEGWQANVEWWRGTLANLRSSVYYREPPRLAASRQLGLFDGETRA